MTRTPTQPSITARLLTAALACAALASGARAQDTSPDLRDLRPFVMMMVDTSGSMELQINCTCTTLSCNECMPVCDPGSNDPMTLRPPDEKKSRWMVTLEALTGTFTDYQCTLLDRTAVNGSTYDLGYYRQYGQPWECATPDGAGDSCKAYPPLGGPSGAIINQTDNGILDVYGERARFGLMTFDGWDTYVGAPPLVDFNQYDRAKAFGQDGLWSYGSFSGATLADEYSRPFDGTEADGGILRIPGHFKYPNCPTTYQMDTGARGPNATEGALRTVDSCASPPCSMVGLANKIQEVLLDTRPWGGTPIAAMLEDLYFHLAEDNTDAFAACRNTFGVLITDGKPDDDYRKFGCDCYQDTDPQAPGYCGSGGGNDPLALFCPYMKPADIARDLVMGRAGVRPPQLLELHVIGLSLDDEARAILDEVAMEGGTEMVQDVDNQMQLTESLDKIVKRPLNAATRNTPLFLKARKPESLATRQYEISTGFKAGVNEDDPWTGFIERRRYECQGGALTDIPIPDHMDNTPSSDRFETRLNAQNNRTMWTVVPRNAPMVPNLLENYFAGSACGIDGKNCVPTVFANQAGMFQPAGMLGDTDLGTNVNPTLAEVVNWMIGAAGTVRDGNRLGDIYRSVPQVIGAPVGDIGDASFNRFRQEAGVRNRPLTLYVNSNDGVLHAFAIEPVFNAMGMKDYEAGEEIWSFVPPMLLPRLKDQLTSRQELLDGTPTVKNMYLSRPSGSSSLDVDASYRTVLVTGMRRGGRGYVALDVTDPTKPSFLWQFVDPDMGLTYGQPALVQASFGFNRGGNKSLESRGVAILPGGAGREADFSGDEPGCDLVTQTAPSFVDMGGGAKETLTGVGELGTLPHRPRVRCWESEGRALYFVDLQTGQLIKKLHQDVMGNTMFPSPLIGSPIAFSDEVGVEASRAFITDADGVIWRIDISDTTQQMEDRGAEGKNFHDGWTARPFHDIFYDRGPAQGEVSLPRPVLTRDESDNLVLILGTGDTDDYAKLLVENRVVSLTEVIRPGLSGAFPDDFQAALNWQLMVQPTHPGLAVSELVTGPLTIFEDTVYLSSFISVPGADPCDFGKGRMWALHTTERGAQNTLPPVTYGPQMTDVYAGLMIADEDKVINIDQATAKEDLLLQAPTVVEGVSCRIITPSLADTNFDYDDQFNVSIDNNAAFAMSDGNYGTPPPGNMLVAPAATGGMATMTVAQQLVGAATSQVRSDIARPPKRTRIMGIAGGAD